MKRANKTTMVLNHLKSGLSISSLEAIELFSATRLSAIIFNLRNKGYNIVSEKTLVKDKFGNPCTFVKYKLIEQQDLFTSTGQKKPPITPEYYKKETEGTFNRTLLQRLWQKISSAGK